MKSAIALLALSLALEAGFLLQIALPATRPAPLGVPRVAGARVRATDEAPVARSTVRSGPSI